MRVAQNRKIKNNLFINTDISEVSVRSFVLTYYDSYHNDPKYQKSIDIQVNIFLSEPPHFLNSLNNLTVNICSVYYYDLPDAFDPENNTFTISTIGENSFWTETAENSTHYLLKLDASQLGPLTLDTHYVIKIKIIDSTGAFTIYDLNVTVLKFIDPYFNNINNIALSNFKAREIDLSIISEFEISISDFKIEAYECSTKNNLQWIQNKKTNGKISMIINPIQVYNKIYCVILNAQFKCNSPISIASNQFNITIANVNHPPICTNTVPTIIMYYGQETKAVQLPDNLFTDPDGDILKYSSTGCVENSLLKLASRIRSDLNINTLYLFVKKFSTGKCQISITATDPSDQSNTILVNVEVLNCTSKDCVLCDGNLQINCQKCTYGYELETTSRACLQIMKYQTFYFNSLYHILGIITFIVILFPICLSLLYGKITLLPIMYIQLITAIVFSNDEVSQNIKDYFEWLQIYKLDFGFLNNIFRLNYSSLCLFTNYSQFNLVHMYCGGLAINFIYLIIFICILLAAKYILIVYSAHIKKYCIAKVITSALISLFDSQFMWWCFHNILFIYPTCLVFFDITNATKQPVNALLSIIVVILIIFAVFKSGFKCVSGNLFLQNRAQYSSIYVYMHILRNICVVCLFCSSSSSNKTIIYIAFWCVQLAINVYFVFLIMNGVIKQYLLMVIYEICIITWLPYFQLKLSMKSNSSKFSDNFDFTFCLLISGMFIICMMIMLWPDFNKLKSLWQAIFKSDQNINQIQDRNVEIKVNTRHIEQQG